MISDPSSATVLCSGSLRLYTNGALHSQYSPKHMFTGGVWDLLGVAPLFQQMGKHPRILMLGVGGGAAIHQLNRLLDSAKITGIEFNSVHIKVARIFFGLSMHDVNIIKADAYRWVGQTRAKFEVVIDDLFVDSPGDPVRLFDVNETWLDRLHSRLSTSGVLIQNHLTTKSATQAASLVAHQFASAILFRTPRYENTVLALYRQPVRARLVRHKVIKMIKKVDPRSLKKLNFRLQQIF